MSSLSNVNNEDFLLRTISEGTATQTGAPFFRALVKNLSLALGTHGAWVTEHLPEQKRLRALAFWLGDDYVDHYEYDIQGTPCEKSLKEKSYLHIPDNVVELFPADPDLSQMGAVSYMGFPLLDHADNILGNLAVVDLKPMPESLRNLSLFHIFAARATAELLRMRAEARLRDREEKLKGVFEGALDAIVELDRDFRITMLNRSAQHLFGISAQEAPGAAFKPYLEGKEFRRLTGLIKELAGRPKTGRNIWIPEGLRAVSATGGSIRTEATLSQIELHGAPYYVLILRNVNERYEAEKRIETLKDEADYLRDEIRALRNHGDIIGKSRVFRHALQLAAEVAPTDSTVLIYGETGTGKELIARSIHAAGRRRNRPLVTVNCAAIPDALMESEFFGHEKGAFTGATQRREGRFSLADGGSIFLDEVGELNREMQAKLLRVLQEGEFAPVGSSRVRTVDVRVIAATNRDLSRAVQEGHFRTDLYYRLNVFPITVPPLRQRSEDIGLLADYFVEKYARRMGKPIATLSPDLLDRMKAYDWPGNVRELQNVIERGVITARRGRLNLDHALPYATQPSARVSADADADAGQRVKTVAELQQLERDNLLRALKTCDWRVAGKTGAAQLLGIPPSTLQSRMKALKIRRPAGG
jgi:PAS domain S-box-containing protein